MMLLDSSVLRAPALDHRGLDLSAVRRIRYVLEQSFCYEYDAPVQSLRQRLVIVPPPVTATSICARTASRWAARRRGAG